MNAWRVSHSVWLPGSDSILNDAILLQKENNLPAEKPEATKGEELSEEAMDKIKEDAQASIDAGKPGVSALAMRSAY